MTKTLGAGGKPAPLYHLYRIYTLLHYVTAVRIPFQYFFSFPASLFPNREGANTRPTRPGRSGLYGLLGALCLLTSIPTRATSHVACLHPFTLESTIVNIASKGDNYPNSLPDNDSSVNHPRMPEFSMVDLTSHLPVLLKECQEAWRVFPIRISSHHIRYTINRLFIRF